MKKIIFILCFLIVISISSFKVSANTELELTKDAKSAVLLEPTTMEIIYSCNPFEKLEPASLTKIMTMILVCEALDDGVITNDQMLVASENATKMGGTQIYLEVGEKMSVDDLLKSVAIASANDAAVVLAEGIAGSLDNFVKKMNQKAEELKLTNTYFKNPNGLPEEGHFSCAMDMALMSAHLINCYSDIILKYTSKYEDYVREDTTKRFWLVNRNKLVRFVEGVDGLKTGWTNNAGYCLSATIKKNDVRYIAVVMKCSTPDKRLDETMQMLNYAVANYEIVKVLKAGDVVKTINDVNVTPNVYNIVVANDVNILKRKGGPSRNISIEEAIDYKNVLNDAGYLNVFIDGKLYSKVSLEVQEHTRKSSFFEVFLTVIKEMFLVSK